MNPEDSLPYALRGELYVEQGDYDLAIADFNKAIELDPESYLPYSLRGDLYVEQGVYDLAIADFNKVIESNPEDALAHLDVGEARLYLAQWEEAQADLAFARSRGVDIVASFQSYYDNVADFERQTGLTMPAELAEMLGG